MMTKSWKAYAFLMTLTFQFIPTATAELTDFRKVVGSEQCEACHEQERAALEDSLHSRSLEELRLRPSALRIAERLGLSDPFSEGLCLDCHATTGLVDGERSILESVGCESCHGGGEDFMADHPREKTDAPTEWAAIESMGMITPARLYDLATRCYGCHLVTSQELVDRGGHSVGSAFELLSWSQGEIRHNTWYNGDGSNTERGESGRRLLFLLGTTIEHESVLRAIANADGSGRYRSVLDRRLQTSRHQAQSVIQACPDLELATMKKYLDAEEKGEVSEQDLIPLADRLRAIGMNVLETFDGSELSCLDPLLPDPTSYRGKPYQP